MKKLMVLFSFMGEEPNKKNSYLPFTFYPSNRFTKDKNQIYQASFSDCQFTIPELKNLFIDRWIKINIPVDVIEIKEV